MGPLPAGGRPRPWLVLLLPLCVASGAASLVYELVWFQLLQLRIGSSAVSLVVLLGTFMSGMCLGSLLLPRLVSPKRHPLRVYALLELGIGISGVLLLFLLPGVGRVYTAWAGDGVVGFALRGAVAGVCLLPPTVMMGATLPALSRSVNATSRGIPWLGYFYASNTGGAVLGCTMAGFYLLRVYDVETVTYLAASANLVVAAIAWVIAWRHPSVGGGEELDDQKTEKGLPVTGGAVHGSWDAPVLYAIALSGFCALAAQAIWTRLLALQFGATTYTFSIILAVFLVGVAVGSWIGSVLSGVLRTPRVALGWCQMLLVGATAWTGYRLTHSLSYWSSSAEWDIWFTFLIDSWRASVAMFPATVLWGASVPLALSALATSEREAGRLTGSVYAANTLGGAFGAVGGSVVLIGWLGSRHAQLVVMGGALLAGFLILSRAFPPLVMKPPRVRWSGMLLLLGSCAWTAVLAGTIAPVPGLLVAHGRHAASYASQGLDFLYVCEGLHSSVAVSRLRAVRSSTTTPGRCKRRVSRWTCASNGCWAISRHSYHGTRVRCSSLGAGPG